MSVVTMLALLASAVSPAAASSAVIPPRLDLTVAKRTELERLNDRRDELERRADAKPGAEVDAELRRTAEALVAAATGYDADPHAAVLLARGYLALAALEQSANKMADAARYAGQAKVLLVRDRRADPSSLLQAIAIEGQAQVALGKYGAAVEVLAEGLDYSKALRADGAAVSLQQDSLSMAESNIAYVRSIALVQLGRYDDAVNAQQLSVAGRDRAYGADHPTAIAARTHLAARLMRAGRAEEAEALARQLAEKLPTGAEKPTIGGLRVLAIFSQILANIGKRGEAIEVARRVADTQAALSGRSDYNYRFQINTLGQLLADTGRYKEAAAVLDEAAAIGAALGTNDLSSDKLRTFVPLGAAKLALGDVTGARDALEQAYVQWQKSGGAGAGEAVMPLLALVRLDSGDVAGARNALTEQLAAATPQRPLTPMGLAQVCTMAALVEVGSAQCTAVPPTQLVTQIAQRGDATADGALLLADRVALEMTMRVAARNNDGPLALEAAQMLAGSTVAAATRQASERTATADPALGTRLRTLQDATRAFRRADSIYALALGNGIEPEKAKTRRDEAVAQLALVRAGIAGDFPRWSQLAGRAPARIADVRRGLAQDTAVLGFVSALSSNFAVAVTPTDVQVTRAPVTSVALADDVARLRASIDEGRFDRDAAHRLYGATVGTVSGVLDRKISSLRIVAGGAASDIPFATLLERPSGAGRQNAYLVRRYALAATAQFSGSSGAPRSAARGVGLLALGAPTPFGNGTQLARADMPKLAAVYRGGRLDSSTLAALAPLPTAKAEVDAVARAFGPRQATVLTGDAASEDAFNRLPLNDFRVMLFATHALVAGEVEGIAEPGLVLARPQPGAVGDGVLTASEIAALSLDADWVVLSACNTAAGDVRGAPAYSGLAQAFRFAGARTMVLSLWPVRDDAATRLVTSALGEAARGAAAPQALRKAMLRLMRGGMMADAANPRVWAPFVVFD